MSKRKSARNGMKNKKNGIFLKVLTETERPRKYWSDLKAKLQKEGSELSDFFGQLKLMSPDGKIYSTDVADNSLNANNL